MNHKNEDSSYRSELRNHFMGHITKPKFQQSAAPHYKDHLACQAQKMPEFDSYTTQHQQQQQQHHHRQASRCNGGDADRALYDTIYAGQQQQSSQADSYRGSSYECNNFSRHFGNKTTKPIPALPMPSTSNNIHKYHADDANVFPYETNSNIGSGGPSSEESNKSQKSSKTIISRRSSQDLRKMVKSQCKLHEVIDETLKQMCAVTDPDTRSEPNDCRRSKDTNVAHKSMQKQSPASCKRCTDKVYAHASQKDVMTEMSKDDFLECRTGETLTISVDDVVNSKVINPMIRKLQRMYLNNLREEMSLMEDLERLPHKVNEVYKATIFKQKE